MMQVKQTTMFHFQSVQGETTYNFSIPAETKSEACQKLANALTAIAEELNSMMKAGTKAN